MSSTKRRRSYESGHRPKFLVVADGSPEFDRALYFAARRAARTGSSLQVLAVAPAAEQQEWLGVGDLMRAEAEAEANERLDYARLRSREIAGIEPECLTRTGQIADEIIRQIEADEDIAILILAAAAGGEGPVRWSRHSQGREPAASPFRL